MSIESAVHPSLRNYVEFLRFFRGSVTELPTSIVVDSDRKEFTMMIPLRLDGADALDRFEGSILALPWVLGLEERLSGSRRRRTAEIVFMSKPIATGGLQGTAEVTAARSMQELEEFSLVQARAFTENPDEFHDWFPWLRSANLRNGVNEGCHFLIARVHEQPASVTLLVESASACGIYAVATPPEHRGKGLASLLLRTSESIAARLGYTETMLQVYADTYAHGFYRRRGFHEDYRVGVWQ